MSVLFSSCFTDPNLSEWSYVNYAAGANKLSVPFRACESQRCLSCGNGTLISSGVQQYLPPDKLQGSFRYQLAVYNPAASGFGDTAHVAMGNRRDPGSPYGSTDIWWSMIVKADRSISFRNTHDGDNFASAPGVYPALDGAWHGVQLPFRLYELNDGIFGSTQGYVEGSVVVDNVELFTYTHILLTHQQEYWNAAIFTARRGGTDIANAVSCLEVDDSRAVTDWPACGATPINARTLCGGGVIPTVEDVEVDCPTKVLIVTGFDLIDAAISVTAPDGTVPTFSILDQQDTTVTIQLSEVQNGTYCVSAVLVQ